MLAEVVVDLKSFRFDEPLTYSVPEPLRGRATVGSLVRVPLRSRHVRGWIVAVGDEHEANTLPLSRISGPAPIFDPPLLDAMRRLARRFVAPLPSMLALLTPPRLGRARGALTSDEGVPREFESELSLPFGPQKDNFVNVWRPAPLEDPVDEYLELIDSTLASGRGVIVLVPEVKEGSRVLDRIRRKFETICSVVHSEQSPADRASALWAVALGSKSIVLGSRAGVFAPAFGVGLIIVHSEHDRSFKEQRAPYYDARTVAVARAAATDAAVFLVSPTPSLFTIQNARRSGWSGRQPERNVEKSGWPAVEIVEPRRIGIARRVIASIISSTQRNERTLVLLPRAQSTPTGPGPERVAEFIRRVVPSATVSRADRGALGDGGALATALQSDVVIATESALAEIERPEISTAVALDADVFLQRPAGRAAEEGFQILWSLASLVVGREPRGRLLLETTSADHHCVQALTRGDYLYFAERELKLRLSSASPPFTSLVVLRAPRLDEDLLARLGQLAGTEVLGPVPGRRGEEVLLKVEELEEVLDPLRKIVSGAPGVLVEVDPRDW